ncbi:MAG: Hsp20/alpha crystallin family protein [Candidatus Pacearchaeota archaeon]
MFEDVFDEIRRLQESLNRSFRNFWESSKTDFSMRTPLSDIEETDKELIVKFEIPGVDKKDINLNVTEDRIEVKVERKQQAKEEKRGFYREERAYRGFYKAISLPCEVIPEKTKAKYKDGILEVVMQKTEQKKKNKIEIE